MKQCPKCKINYTDSFVRCTKCGRLLDDPLPLGSIFTDKDKDFHEYRRGFKF